MHPRRNKEQPESKRREWGRKVEERGGGGEGGESHPNEGAKTAGMYVCIKNTRLFGFEFEFGF